MSGPALSVGRGVVTEMSRVAAYEVPGVSRVSRGGPRWLAALSGPPVVVRIRDHRVHVRVFVVVRPGQPLSAVADGVRSAVERTVERLLGLDLGAVTVIVDGVGG